MGSIRPLELGDVPELAALAISNRQFLAPWEPDRDETFFSTDGQRSAVREALNRRDQDLAYPHVILDDPGQIVGRDRSRQRRTPRVPVVQRWLLGQ